MMEHSALSLFLLVFYTLELGLYKVYSLIQMICFYQITRPRFSQIKTSFHFLLVSNSISNSLVQD